MAVKYFKPPTFLCYSYHFLQNPTVLSESSAEVINVYLANVYLAKQVMFSFLIFFIFYV